MMRAGGLEMVAIFALIVPRSINCVDGANLTETPIEKSIKNPEHDLPTEILKAAALPANNVSKNNGQMDYWMARMGTMQDDLINVQAMIVKDEDATGACDQAERKSNKRYLMCAGSILNRNHVLSSASCLHEATHIRHNIRSPLAVVIAPLKPSIQVIRVTEYKIHPDHNTNPYSRHHSTHNVAILKLACRIDMENYYKVELPIAPFVQTCSEDNCVVAIYRKTGMTSNVMFQILAPNIPFPNRRRKETMVKDVELRGSRYYRKIETVDDFLDHPRQKRKLAEPPVFISRYELRRKINDVSANATTSLPIEHSTIEAPNDRRTIVSSGSIDLTDAAPTNLKDDVYKTRLNPALVSGTIRSFVRRSSNGYRSCAHTGAAVMSNRTQAAVASAPCDDRQPSTKWVYTDMWDNLDWIHDILQDWGTNTSAARPSGAMPSGPGGQPGSPGNYSGCSTCIFNFFIEIGCKDKNRCGNKSIAGQDAANSMSGTMNQNQGCSGANSIGIEVGIGGQGCDKKAMRTANRPEFRGMPIKPIDLQIGPNGKQKHLSSVPEDGTVKLEQQPVTGAPIKTADKEHRNEKDKYSRKDSNSQRSDDRSSSMAQSYKTLTSKNARRDHSTNEIGLQNIEGDSTDWLSEVEKGLEMSSEIKRELVESQRSS